MFHGQASGPFLFYYLSSSKGKLSTMLFRLKLLGRLPIPLYLPTAGCYQIIDCVQGKILGSTVYGLGFSPYVYGHSRCGSNVVTSLADPDL